MNSDVTVLVDKYQLLAYIRNRKIPTTWVKWDGQTPHSEDMIEYYTTSEVLASWKGQTHEGVSTTKTLLKG